MKAPTADHQFTNGQGPSFDRDPPFTETSNAVSEDKYGFSFHIYGGSGALTIAEAETRKGVPTINIEGAKSPRPRTYDWKNKIMLQVTASELPLFAAVCAGMADGFKGTLHGPDHDKGFEIKNQGSNLYVSVFQAGKGAIGVPVTAADSLRLSTLVLDQLRKHLRLETLTDTLNMLKTQLPLLQSAAKKAVGSG